MISVDNISYLKYIFPNLYQDIKAFEASSTLEGIEMRTAKNGENTLAFISPEKELYLHSAYDPSKEAEVILESYAQVDQYEQVIFYGTGLGYHIEAFMKKYPKKKYHIYEPSFPLLYQYISNHQLHEGIQSIAYGAEIAEMEEFMLNTLQTGNKYTLFIDLPAHKNIYPDLYQLFLSTFKSMISDRRRSINTDYRFQKQWTTSAMINYPEVLKTPNIMSLKNKFSGKTAIIAAAGPSLTEEIENLRYIKESGLAYIFSVGTAVNALIEHGFYPHATCTYDPFREENKRVFQKIIDDDIDEIPLIYASTGGVPVEQYPGPKFHMFINKDTLSVHYLKMEDNSEIEILHDAPTIAAVTLELLCKLGFSKIIFVGQNLAYRNKRSYAEGTGVTESSELNFSNMPVVKSVDGEEIYTSEGFNQFRNTLEFYISQFPEVTFLNATKGGADIAGAAFYPLEEIIPVHLRERIYDESWLDTKGNGYSCEYLYQQMQIMNSAYDEALKIMKQMDDLVKNIAGLYRNRNYKQIEKMYNKIEDVFPRMDNNAFFATYLYPMNRVYLDLLKQELRKVLTELNVKTKVKTIVTELGKFNYVCKRDLKIIQPILEKIHETIISLQ